MISDNDITSNESLGVTKKLLGQYKAFNNLGYDTYHLCFKDEQGVLIHGDDTKVMVKKQPKLYFTYIKLLKLADKVCQENKIDLCYIRYTLADFAFMKMIKKLHKICKIIVEIPTYPYENEIRSGIEKILYFQDRCNQNKLKKYIDNIVTFHGFNEIFGIKTISVDNGIDIDNVKYIGDKIRFDEDINLIGVARIVNSHGYDRLIEGLRIYYSDGYDNKEIVNFYIVGDGNELPNLKNLVDNYGLSNHVIFTGIKSGEELDALFENSTIGIASLASHRRGNKTTSELKVKEYCARGIPFICSLPDVALPDDCEFRKLVASNEEPIDIKEIVEFYEYIKQHPELSLKMRKFAEENFTWEKQLKKVINSISDAQ